MPQAFFFSVTYKKMRLVARISSDQVSSKTDVTMSSYEGFKFTTPWIEDVNSMWTTSGAKTGVKTNFQRLTDSMCTLPSALQKRV